MDYFFIGDGDLVTAFRFAGVGGAAVSSEEETKSAFNKITKSNKNERCKILILSEQAADWLGEELNEWQLSGEYPLIVEVPGIDGPISGRKTLVESIREAIGIHV